MFTLPPLKQFGCGVYVIKPRQLRQARTRGRAPSQSRATIISALIAAAVSLIVATAAYWSAYNFLAGEGQIPPAPSVEVMTLTPEQRTAQRKIVGMLNLKSAMWFEPSGDFCIWRDNVASEWGGGIPEVSAHFDTLEIPYSVRLEILNIGKPKKRPGLTLVVQLDDLPALTRWVPSFQQQVDKMRVQLAQIAKNAETVDSTAGSPPLD